LKILQRKRDERPLDGIVLTEHRQFDLRRDFRDLEDRYGLLILNAAEVETDYGHVLVYGVSVDATRLHVRLTMTSAACPVVDVIIDDVERELDRVLPAGLRIEVELVWEPAWTAERMSEGAKRFMGW